MENYEKLKSQAADLICSAARKETVKDGFDTLIADYVAAKVHDAFEIGWRSALVNSINLIKKLEL